VIVVRSPLRITLGGGATDLPSYYQEHGGFCIGAAINKYVYMVLNRHFASDVIVKYSKTERVTYAENLEHPILREAFGYLGQSGCGVELACLSDIPAGTGLGSSSSFTAALVKTLALRNLDVCTKEGLAKAVCDIELGRLKEPIGKQDQYATVFGGINAYLFKKDGTVVVRPLASRTDNQAKVLKDNLRLVFTGFERSASKILADQQRRSRSSEMLDNLHKVKLVGELSWDALAAEDYEAFAGLLTRQHELKNQRCGALPKVEELHALGLENGALGGRLLGAGGGGFLMFYVADHASFNRMLRDHDLKECSFGFDWEGTKVLINE
jgi:D-glycero-alpha-D-manno-heptose-7-phosphate kinase